MAGSEGTRDEGDTGDVSDEGKNCAANSCLHHLHHFITYITGELQRAAQMPAIHDERRTCDVARGIGGQQ